MAGAAHATVGRPAIVGGKLGAIVAVQGAGQAAQAQLLHGVRKEADRPRALHSVLAQLRAVPARTELHAQHHPQHVVQIRSCK